MKHCKVDIQWLIVVRGAWSKTEVIWVEQSVLTWNKRVYEFEKNRAREIVWNITLVKLAIGYMDIILGNIN